MNKKDKSDPIIREQPATYDDYAAMPEDNGRFELVHGVLELMSPGASPK